MDYHTSTDIQSSEFLDANSFVESVENHFPEHKEEQLLEVALSKDSAKGDHGSTCTEVTSNERVNGDVDLFPTLDDFNTIGINFRCVENLVKEPCCQDGPLESPD